MTTPAVHQRKEQNINPEYFKPKPIDEVAFKTALEAFRILDYGAQTGEWEPFIEMLHDDLTWFGPVGGYQGLKRGKDSAANLFRHHAKVTRTH